MMLQSCPQNVQIASCSRSLRARSRRCSKPSDGSRSTSGCNRFRSEVDLRETVLIPTALPESASECLADTACALTYDLVTDALEGIMVDNGIHEVDSSMMEFSHMQEAGENDDGYDSVLENVDEIEEAAYFDMAGGFADGAFGGPQLADKIEDWKTMTEETAAYWEAWEMDTQQVAALDGADEAYSEPEGEWLDVDMDDEEDERDFWDEDTFEGDVLAFDMATNAIDDAFEEMYVPQSLGMQGECGIEETKIETFIKHTELAANAQALAKEEEVKDRVRNTLQRALRSGVFAKELQTSFQNSKWDAVQQKLQSAFTEAASTGALERAFREMGQSSQHAPKPESEAQTSPAPIDSQVEGPTLQTTCVATFVTAPFIMPEGALTLSPEPETTTSPMHKAPETPMRSSRSKRRIIGAVVRGPALEHKEDVVAPSAIEPQRVGSSRSSRTHSKSSHKHSKRAAEVFDMEASRSGRPSKSFGRDSSLTRGYSALGANFFSMNAEDDKARDFSFNCGEQISWQTGLKFKVSELGAPAFDRPSSKAGAKLRAASMSAMAMDLGCADPVSEHKLCPSTPMGSSRLAKAKISHSGLLPMLPVSKKSAQSIAKTMKMSKTTSKWCHAGLHTSASAVF